MERSEKTAVPLPTQRHAGSDTQPLISRRDVQTSHPPSDDQPVNARFLGSDASKPAEVHAEKRGLRHISPRSSLTWSYPLPRREDFGTDNADSLAALMQIAPRRRTPVPWLEDDVAPSAPRSKPPVPLFNSSPSQAIQETSTSGSIAAQHLRPTVTSSSEASSRHPKARERSQSEPILSDHQEHGTSTYIATPPSWVRETED